MQQEELWSVPDFYTLGLTNKCNSQCGHCFLYKEGLWSMSYPEVQLALEQVSSIQTLAGKDKVKVLSSGGECTLWGDKEYSMSFGGLLTYIHEQDIVPRLFTNGKKFRHVDGIEKVFGSFFEQYPNARVKVNMSIDIFHQNFEDKHCQVLDNLLEYRNSHPSIDIEVVSEVSSRPREMVPHTMIEHYRRKKVEWRVEAVVDLGPGVKLGDYVPKIRIQGCNKSSLGAFNKSFYEKLCNQGIVSNWQDYEQMSNREIIQKLNFCGRTPSPTVLWGAQYYNCIPHSIVGDPAFVVASKGELSKERVLEFQSRMPLLKEIRQKGMVEVADQMKGQITPSSRKRIEQIIDEGYANPKYTNCLMCLRLSDEGIWQELNASSTLQP